MVTKNITFELLPYAVVLNDFHTVIPLTFITTLCGTYNYFLHFMQGVSNLTKVRKLINSRTGTEIQQSFFKTYFFNCYTIVFPILMACPRATNIFFSHIPKLIFPDPHSGEVLVGHNSLLKLYLRIRMHARF